MAILHKINQSMVQPTSIIIIPKGDSIEGVLDNRHLNSNTEQSDEYWPIEPLTPQLTRAKKVQMCYRPYIVCLCTYTP